MRYFASTKSTPADAMPLIVPANEQGAGFMAAGYARASGRVGVALVTSGPGATNMVTPVRDCMADSVPIVVICGQVPTTAIGTDAFQEAPVPSIMGAVAKHVFPDHRSDQAPGGDGAHRVRDRAHRPAGPGGARCSQGRAELEGRFHGEGRLPIPGYRQRMRACSRPASVPRCRLRQFFAAAGARSAADLCRRRRHQRRRRARSCASSCAIVQIPVVTTLMGIGAVDTTHPLSMRMLGMHGAAFANYAVDDCDFLMAVGARFDDRVAGNPRKICAQRAKFIAHLDIDASEINKVKRVALEPCRVDARRACNAAGLRQGASASSAIWPLAAAAARSCGASTR
jgi:acetolactate synthase-1/2/3 large subunit